MPGWPASCSSQAMQNKSSSNQIGCLASQAAEGQVAAMVQRLHTCRQPALRGTSLEVRLAAEARQAVERSVRSMA